MDFGLKDKVVIITGAASGFGQAATRLLLKSNANLVLADLNTQGLESDATSKNVIDVRAASGDVTVASAS